jgi:hypothetical protein
VAQADPPASAPVHRAPPESWRPLSKAAVVLFAVSLVTVLLSLGGFLAVTALLLLVHAVVLGTVRWSARRGRGLVLVSLGITVLVGVAGYANAKAVRHVLADRANRLLGALRGGDEEAVGAWVHEEARRDGAVARIRRRYEEATRAAGGYRGSVEVGDLWFGAAAVLVPPAHGPEVVAAGDAPGGGEPPEGSLWVRAAFEKEPIHVALVPKDAARAEGQFAMMMKVFGPERSEGLWEDVRFYRAAP